MNGSGTCPSSFGPWSISCSIDRRALYQYSHPSLQFALFESAIRLVDFETVDSVILITGKNEKQAGRLYTHSLVIIIIASFPRSLIIR